MQKMRSLLTETCKLPVLCMQVLLYRTRLRRGAQGFWVKSLLYIPPERSTGTKKSLGQVI